MKSKALLIKAVRDPMPEVQRPLPNQLYKHVQVYMEQRELPALHPLDIRLEMLYVGICGTDVHVTSNHPETGYISCSAPLSIPESGRVIGHEGVGRVIEAGSEVKHLSPGMIVTMESIIVCYRCPACRQGKFNQCENAELLGLEKDGLLGNVVDVPASIAHDISGFIRDERDLIAAAAVEPAAVAYVGCENARIRPGDCVVVFGAGPIGVFAAMLSKRVFGAAKVLIVEPNEFRRTFSRKWADEVYSVEQFFAGIEGPVDVVIEASAILDNVTRVFPYINANGRVVLLGRKGIPLHIEHVDHMITNEISIVGSRGHLGGAFHRVMKLHQTGIIRLDDAMTRIVHGIDDMAELLRKPTVIERENCKVMVQMTAVKGESTDGEERYALCHTDR